MHLIDEVVGYAKANAEAAKNPDEHQTWDAHYRNCVLIQAEMEQLRNTLKLEGQYRAGGVAEATRLRAALVEFFAPSDGMVTLDKKLKILRAALGDQQKTPDDEDWPSHGRRPVRP